MFSYVLSSITPKGEIECGDELVPLPKRFDNLDDVCLYWAKVWGNYRALIRIQLFSDSRQVGTLTQQSHGWLYCPELDRRYAILA
jgi:hypothetical protein